MLGAGMVIIQPETSKIVVVHDEVRDRWFLPKGRKDVGESLEQAALREAYEEVRGTVFAFTRYHYHFLNEALLDSQVTKSPSSRSFNPITHPARLPHRFPSQTK
jgi:8-oxo-dGTP pyrophosphatase MutT (NUDIX family)